MKDRRIQTKRQTKRGFRTLFAKTAVRKQRASTASVADMDEIEGDIPKVGIGRALTVILVLHVVAIAAIYMGTKWKGAEPEGNSSAVAAFIEEDKDTTPKTNPNKDKKFRVSQPSSYQDFERSPQVSHQMPAAQNNTSVTQSKDKYRSQIGTSTQPAVIIETPERQPRVIRPKRNPNAHVNLPPAQEVRYKTHTIVAGDSIYRIALKNKVKPQQILDINNIADARKVRVGMVIKIPVK